MADVKISALPSATTPLDGTELIPIVQSATTKQVPASALVGPQGPQGETGPAGPTIYPGAGIPTSDGSAWGASKNSPSGDLVGTTDTQTLTNKTISGSSNTLSNIGNAALTNSSVTIGSTSVSLGATVTTIAGLSLTAPTIATITNSGTVTVPATTDTLVARATTDTLTNKTMSGASNTFSNIPNTAITGLGTMSTQNATSVSITGGSIAGITDLAVADGGTGASTAGAARSNLLPAYASNAGKVLAVNGSETDVEWVAVGGSGTVTSVALTAPTGFAVTGSPVTTTGTLALAYDTGYALPTTASQANWDAAYSDRLKWDGGATGLDSATGRTSLGLGSAATMTGPSGSIVGTTDAQTLTNKTIAYADNTLTGVQPTLVSGTSIKTINSTTLLGSGDIAVVAATSGTASGITLNDGYTEEVFAVSGTTPALSPTNGSIQTWTLTGNSTPTAGTWAAGQSLTLMIDDGTAYTVTWTSLPVTWVGGSAPTLPTSGYAVIELWKVGTTIYGASVGDVA